jgi:hypothetical protein
VRRLRQALEVHLHPTTGSPFWLARQKELGFDIRAEIREAHDLQRLGTMDPAVLAAHPLDHFLPRSLGAFRESLILGQTGGTLGRPGWTVYTAEEFEDAFVAPFVEAARHARFPAAGCWLYAGPSGPHIIGQAARAVARAHGCLEPFSVDFDPRWARKLEPGSFAAARYLEHIVDQAAQVLQQQTVSVLFSTPVVLLALGQRAQAETRRAIRGVHYGGQALSASELAACRAAFPNAVHLSGYGNTLLGCCMQLEESVGEPVYHAFGARLICGVIPAGSTDAAHITRAPGSSGRLVVSRLDCSVLLVNLIERDDVTLTAPGGDVPTGFQRLGLAGPATAACGLRTGLY